MPSPTFSDQESLQQLFQEAYAPINTLSEGMLAKAMDERRRRHQVEDETRRDAAIFRREQAQSALVLDRQEKIEKIRQEGENKRASAANAAVLDRWKVEHDLMDKEDREKERRKAVEKANEVGANLPASATFDEASKAFIDRHGQSYIAANKRLGVALSGALRATGTNPQVIASRVASMIADDPAVAKQLTIPEREQIRNNPQKLAEFRKQFAGKSKKYEAFVQAMNQASSTITADIEKEAGSKPEAVRAAADLRQATQVIQALQKEGMVSPEVEATAFDEYRKAATPEPPPKPPERNFTLPGGGGARIPGGGGTPAPGAMRALPFTPQAEAAMKFQSPENTQFLQDQRLFLQPQSVQELTNPGAAPNPRLRRFLQDSAAANNSLFPTAYPMTPGLDENQIPGFAP